MRQRCRRSRSGHGSQIQFQTSQVIDLIADRRRLFKLEIAGVAMEHYAAWMKSAYWISTTLCPAISVPAGFTPEGLPVGIQIVGRRGDDAGVLQMAYAFEQATGFSRRRPGLV